MPELPNVPTRGKSPVFVDGRTTEKTYLIVAVKPGADVYNAIGVRRLGSNSFKFHFWPHASFFNVKHDDIYDRGNGGLSHGSYQGLECDWQQAETIIAGVAVSVMGVSTSPMDTALEILSKGFETGRHFHV